MKKTLSMLLALVMVLAMIPLTAFAAEATVLVEVSDQDVTDVAPYEYTWTVESAGTLAVEASGTPACRYKIVYPDGSTSLYMQTNQALELTATGTYSVQVYAYDNAGYTYTNGTVGLKLTFTPSEGGSETPVEKEEYEVSATKLALGGNNVSLLDTAVTTIYEFEPTETGTYTFTAPEGAVVGYWGAGSWFLSNPNSTSNTCEWTCSAVGQSAFVGVSGAEGSTILTVAKSGEYVDTSIKYETYVNTHTPDEKYTQCYTVEGTAASTPLKGDDGFYYIGEKLVVVNFAASSISISAMLGTGAAKYVAYNEDGTVAEAKDYTNALLAYTAVGTKYPMTDDLFEMIPNVVAAKGWVESGYVTSWLDLCNVATVSHTDGETVEEDGYTNTYCSVCGALMSSEEIEATPVDIYSTGADVEVAAGKTVDCNLWFNGSMIMTVAGEGEFTVTYNGTDYAAVNGVVTITGVSSSFWAPATMQITNNGSADATYAVSFAEPVGSMNNPAELVIGKNTAEIAANSQGYFYTWTAETDGVLHITMPEGDWFYVINNLTAGTYGDSQWSDSDPVVNPGSVTVSAGDEIQITVNTYDPADMWNTPAGTLVITAAFKEASAECTHGNLTHMDAVEPGCHYDGNIEYWVCYDCEQVWQNEELTQLTNIKNVVLPATGEGNVVHFDAVEPGCHHDGNIEYWVCYDCEQVWQDEALTQLTNIKNVVLPATGEGNVVHFDAVAPGCHYDGNIEYWVCYDCEQVWQDEALTQLTNIKNVVLPATGGEVIHVEAVEPGCHYDGNIEYWYCPDCEQVWQDEALTQLTNIKNVVLPATGGEVVHVEAVEPGCESDGNIEYWYCEECEQVWQDEALTQLTNFKNVVLPATHQNIVHVESVEPGCHYDGNIEYWYCADCELVWQNEALTQLTNFKNVIDPATGEGNVVHFDAVEPGCHYDGNIEYWVCYDCEQVWQDEALTQLTNIKNVVLPAVGGEVVHVEAVKPGCETTGNIEYWYCEECEQVWQNEALTQLTNFKNVVIAATGHDWDEGKVTKEATCTEKGEMTYTCETCKTTKTEEIAAKGHSYSNGKCIVCGAEDPDYKDTTDNAKTGDESLIVMWTTVMILAAVAAVALVIKKRRMA